MKIFILLMVMFSDGTPAFTHRELVAGTDPAACVEMVRRMVVDNIPGSRFAGHPVKSWSAGCSLEGLGDPT